MFVKIKEHPLKESEFIEQNQDSWQELESYLKYDRKDPDRLQTLFMKVSSDLAYARTYYPNRSVRKYLNSLTQQIFDKLITRTRNERLMDQLKFWFQHTLPREMYRSRRSLLISALIFIVAIAIGVVTSAHDSSFARLILGDSYVHLTETNINKGDPMAIYKDAADVDMFLGITLNNIMVAFFAFILGILGGLGSIYILIVNGIMVGVFQYFFYSKGLFMTSFLTIWIHGTIEISAIIIAGAAGLVLGRGLLFPKTYTRSEALQINAQRALTIMLGTVPLFFIAGLLESFVSRHTGMPDALKWLIIILSAALILGLYVIYPYYYARFLEPDTYKDIRDDFLNQPPDKYKPGIYSFGQYFSFSLQKTKKLYGDYLVQIVAPFSVLAGISHYIQLKYWSSNDLASDLPPAFFNATTLGLVQTILYWITCSVAVYFTARRLRPTLKSKKVIPMIMLISCLPVFLTSFFNGNLGLLILALTPPGFLALYIIKNAEQDETSSTITKSLYQTAWSAFFPFLVPLLIYCFFLYCVQLLISSNLLSLLYSFVYWHDIFNSLYVAQEYVISLSFAIGSLLIIPLSYVLLDHIAIAQLLKRSASDLKEKIKTFNV